MDFRHLRFRPSIQALGLGALACAAALLANALASPARRLEWMRPAPVSISSTPATVGTSAVSATPPPSSQSENPTQILTSAPTPAPAPALTPTLTSASRPAAQGGLRLAPPAPLASVFALDPDHPVRDLDKALAIQAFQLRIPFLDARRSAEYEEGHIARAWCLPVWESDLETRITIFEAGAKPSGPDPLVIYCNGGDCEDSRLLARKLVDLGYRNLWIYKEGYPHWIQEGHPATRGGKP